MYTIPPTPEQQEHPWLASAVNCGCALPFLWVGLLLALPGLLPNSHASGKTPPPMVFLTGIPFAAAGLYFLVNGLILLAHRRRLPASLLFDIIAFSLAPPFHYWLFFGRADQGSAGLELPGGFTLSLPLSLPLNFILAKIGLAVLLVLLDLYLGSKLFGLGRFARPASHLPEDTFPEEQS